VKKNTKKTKKSESGIYAYYVEVESPLDLARQVFDHGPAHVNAVKVKDKFRLFANGEKLGDVRLTYYVDLDKIGRFFVYAPGSEFKERLDITDNVLDLDFKSYRAPIVEALANPYTEVKDMKKAGDLIKVEIKDASSLIKSIAAYSREEDSMPKLYAFHDKKVHIIGTFDFFYESGMRIFTYAKIGINEKFSALSYNYSTDTIEPVNSFPEKSVAYIKVINLKEPFPFF
jgi:hypothetical protein